MAYFEKKMPNAFYNISPSNFASLKFSPVYEYFIAREFDLNFLLPEHVLSQTTRNVCAIYVTM